MHNKKLREITFSFINGVEGPRSNHLSGLFLPHNVLNRYRSLVFIFRHFVLCYSFPYQ